MRTQEGVYIRRAAQFREARPVLLLHAQGGAPAVSFVLSRDVKFTVLFCLLLGDMFIDTLLYDGVVQEPAQPARPEHLEQQIVLDFALGFIVNFLMISVSVGILYVFHESVHG
jgi:hypothetical protein